MKFYWIHIFSLVILVISYTQCCNKTPKGPSVCSKKNGKISSCARMYSDKKCNGNYINIFINQSVNHLNMAINNKFNDRISSLVIKRGCTLTVFEHPNYGGSKKYFVGSIDYLSKDWNDKISSVTCTCNNNQGCPSPKQLSPRTSHNKSMCAVIYQLSRDDPNTSCYGHSKELYNGERKSQILTGLWNDEISSVVVRDGCTLSAYRHVDFGGTKIDLKGVNEHLNTAHFNDRISSYICKCNFPAVDCTPTDIWKRVHACRNRGNRDLVCKYRISHGLSVGTTSSNTQETSGSHTLSVGLSVGSELQKVFTAGYTYNTGYRWSDSIDFSQTETKTSTSEVVFTVPPGETIGVYQVWGTCGNYYFKTQCFESRNIDTAEVIEYKGFC